MRNEKNNKGVSVTVSYILNLFLSGLIVTSSFFVITAIVDGVEADVEENQIEEDLGKVIVELNKVERSGEGYYYIDIPRRGYSYTVLIENDTIIIESLNTNTEAVYPHNLDLNVSQTITLSPGRNRLQVIGNELQKG